MFGDDQLLDSYQNLVCGPAGNQSVETIGTMSHVNGYMEIADIYAADGSSWKSDEDAERIAGEEGDPDRRPSEDHDSEPKEDHEGGHGRAASGESFEDEADNALFRQSRP